MNSHCFRGHRLHWMVLVIVALVSLLAGCDSPAATTASPTPVILIVTETASPVPVAPAETPLASAIPAEETPQDLQPCSLITQAEAEAILGEPAAPAQEMNGACAFNNAKDSLYVVSVAAAQDKQTEGILQGQAFLLGMAGAPLDQPTLDKLKALSDAQDFKGYFAELVALAQNAPAAKAQLVDGVGDAGYWLWLTADTRRQGALVVARGPTLVNVNLVVADSQTEPAMLDASKVLADKVFSRLPAHFVIPSGSQ
jgi:hypothetical protein